MMILSLTNRVILMIQNISPPEVTDNKIDNEFRFPAIAGIFLFSTVLRPGANRRLFLQRCSCWSINSTTRFNEVLQWAYILITTLTCSCLLLSQSAKDCLPCIWTLIPRGNCYVGMLVRRNSVVSVSGNAFQITLVIFY